MNYLIDTHVLIWFGETSSQLPVRIRHIIEETNNNIFVSHASIWEMAIKLSLGKLQMRNSLAKWEEFLHDSSFSILPASFRHYEALQKLPFHHNDPFDRLIIAQSIAEDFTILTHDQKFLAYPVQVDFF